MDNIASELALIVCKQCKRLENESDIDFSKRLYSVYRSCEDAIEGAIKQEDNGSTDSSVEAALSTMNC